MNYFSKSPDTRRQEPPLLPEPSGKEPEITPVPGQEGPREEERARTQRTSQHLWRYRLILFATFGAFLLSCWLTAKGLFDRAIEAGTASPEGMVTALMSAAVAATLIGLATMLVFGVALGAIKRQRWSLVFLAIALMPFMLGISTYNAVLGNAGPPSLADNLADTADAIAAHYEGATSDAAGAQSAAAALAPTKASICALADGEKDKGVLSGYAGKGGVYAAYLSGCESVGVIVETLSDTAARTQSRRDEAGAHLAALKSIPRDSKRNIFARKAAFEAHAEALRKLLEASGAENVTRRLQAQLKALEGSIVTLGVKDGAFGKKQAKSIEDLRAKLAHVSAVVTEMLAAAPVQQGAAPPRLLSMAAAVRVYWDRNIPSILIAIASDFMWLWFLGLLSVSRAGLEPPQASPSKKRRNRRKGGLFKALLPAKKRRSVKRRDGGDPPIHS